MVKIQNKIISLKAQGKKPNKIFVVSYCLPTICIGKNAEVAEFEKKLDECNEQFKVLMSPENAQVQKSAICR